LNPDFIHRIVFSSDDDGAAGVEELEPVLGERVLAEVFAHVVEVDILKDNVLQVKPNGSHLRSGLKILDNGLGDAAWKASFLIQNFCYE